MYELTFYPHARSNTPTKTVRFATYAEALTAMNKEEFDNFCHIDRANYGGTVATNYPNSYAIASYDKCFEVEALFEARNPAWRAKFNEYRLY